MSSWEQLWNGISPCMEPGVGDCVVWWDAWAASGALAAAAVAVLALSVAWIGVLVTATSALAVWRVGVEANRSSQLAVSLARAESERQAVRDRRERTLVLVQINGEVFNNKRLLSGTYKKLASPDAKDNLVNVAGYLAERIIEIEKVEFPITRELADRLHYLGDSLGPTLARCTGMARALADTYRDGFSGPSKEDRLSDFEALRFAVNAMVEDLEVVGQACRDAIIESGIDNDRIARLTAARAGVAKR